MSSVLSPFPCLRRERSARVRQLRLGHPSTECVSPPSSFFFSFYFCCSLLRLSFPSFFSHSLLPSFLSFFPLSIHHSVPLSLILPRFLPPPSSLLFLLPSSLPLLPSSSHPPTSPVCGYTCHANCYKKTMKRCEGKARSKSGQNNFAVKPKVGQPVLATGG